MNHEPGPGNIEVMAFTPPDAAIIARSEKEPAAFADIFDRHAPAVHGLIARRIGWDAAEDLTSEVFTTAFRRRHTYNPAYPNARPWLYGIALNLVRRHVRSATRRSRAHLRLVGHVDAPPDEERHVDDALEAEYLVGILPVGLDALTRDDRETLLLHCWEGLSYDDVAAALDIPVGTVRSRIHRARKQLREHLWPSGESTDEEPKGKGVTNG